VELRTVQMTARARGTGREKRNGTNKQKRRKCYTTRTRHLTKPSKTGDGTDIAGYVKRICREMGVGGEIKIPQQHVGVRRGRRPHLACDQPSFSRGAPRMATRPESVESSSLQVRNEERPTGLAQHSKYTSNHVELRATHTIHHVSPT